MMEVKTSYLQKLCGSDNGENGSQILLIFFVSFLLRLKLVIFFVY